MWRLMGLICWPAASKSSRCVPAAPALVCMAAVSKDHSNRTSALNKESERTILQQIATDGSSKAPTPLLLGRSGASARLMPLLKRMPPACPLVSTHFHQMKASGQARVEFKPICPAPWRPRPRSGKRTPTLTCTHVTTKRTVGEAYCLHLMFLALSGRNM